MARALWKGDISFGLVNIPVELYPGGGAREFKFSMLDKRDFSPVGYKRYSKRSDKEVEWANIVKGYEYEKDQYVVLSDEDFRRANVKASRTIDIKAFVPADEIPPQYYETPYYLAPAERGKKVYALLRETLARHGPRRGGAGRHSHDAAPGRGRARGTRADAQSRCATPTSCATRARSSCRPKGSRAPASRPRKSSSPSGWSTTCRRTGSRTSSRTRTTKI